MKRRSMRRTSEARALSKSRVGLDATMADLRAIASVTKMTVSQVLRHPDRVHPVAVPFDDAQSHR
jgi:hypothetical protein